MTLTLDLSEVEVRNKGDPFGLTKNGGNIGDYLRASSCRALFSFLRNKFAIFFLTLPQKGME